MISMTDEQENKLRISVNESALMREWCSHSGFKLFKREMDAKLLDLKHKWMEADEAEASKIKIRAQVYNEVFSVMKEIILRGDSASVILNRNADETESAPVNSDKA